MDIALRDKKKRAFFNVVPGYNVNPQIHILSLDCILPLWHATLRHPAGNTPHSPKGSLVYKRIIVIFASVFGHISSCSQLYPKRQRGHNSDLGVTLPEIWARSVQSVACGKPF